MNQALATLASEERKRRKLEENERKRLEQDNNKQIAIEDMGDYLVEYKKSVQKLLNDKSCNAGVADGVFGKKTLNAAHNFQIKLQF